MSIEDSNQWEKERIAEIAAAQSEIAAAAPDPEAIMQLVAQRAKALTRADGAAVETVEGEDVVLRAGCGLLETSTSLRLKISASLVGLCIRTDENLCCNDTETDSRVNQEESRKLGVRSIIVVPLRHQYNSVGVLAAVSIRPFAFTETDIQILQLVAHFMAAGINQAVAFGAKQALLAEHTRTIVALRESEERFRRAFDHAPIGMALAGVDGQWMKVNHTLCQIVGYSEQELRSRTFHELIHPDDLEIHHEQMKSLVSGEIGTFQMESRYFHKSGAVVWILLSISLLRDGQGKPLYFIAQMQDITERKRSEEALIMQARVLQNMSEGVCLTDEKGNIVYTNAAEDRMFNYATGELLGFRLTSLNSLTDEENAQLMEEIMAHIGSKGAWRGELKNRKKDGQIFTTASSISLLELSGKKYLIAVQEDITEKKRADQQIQNSLREKEVLLKEIHHRVKNNLQVISSLLNLQSGYIVDDHTQELFRESQNRVKSMALIHEKLYQSQDLARIDFSEYVLSLVSMLFRSYGTNSGLVRLNVVIAKVSLGIDTAIPIGLMINELASNSLKYAFPDGKPGTIVIELKAGPDNSYILIFQDDGVGLPADFDLDKPTSLGLRLVKILTNQIGGELTFHRNRGTEFVINFKEQRERT